VQLSTGDVADTTRSCMVRMIDRTRCRLASLMSIFALPALIVQMLRFKADADTGSPARWIALFAVAFAGGRCLAHGSWRATRR
jgi:hypothetical protein